jgi:hypothetical protein
MLSAKCWRCWARNGVELLRAEPFQVVGRDDLLDGALLAGLGQGDEAGEVLGEHVRLVRPEVGRRVEVGQRLRGAAEPGIVGGKNGPESAFIVSR